MINISEKIGLPIKFNPETFELIFNENVIFKSFWEKKLDSSVIPNEPLWKSLKFAHDFTDESGNIIKQPNLNEFWNKEKLYFGYRGIFLNNKIFLDLISNNSLMPDITVLLSGTVGNEYIRTEGHEHLSKSPEIYEVILGKVIFLIFKTEPENKENMEDVIAVFAQEGDHAIFPPGYQHISINIGNSPLVITDWNSTNANSDFQYIKKHNGAPYWVIKGENGPKFIKNLRYKGKVPEIRFMKPAYEIKEFQIKKGVPMFNLAKEGKINMLDFINEFTGKYDEVYKKIFIPV